MSERPGKARRALQIVLTMGAWIAGLFLGAGTIDWPRGWISVAIYVIGFSMAGLIMRRANPELIAERAKWRRKDTKGFDKIFLAAMMPLAFLQPLAAGLDAVRFGWWPIGPVWIAPGIVLFLFALALITWTLAVNRHAETTVRIQTDREHQVISAGPYRVVRHPMYVGVIVMYLGLPLIWGSGAAMAVSLAIIGLFVWRTFMEDRTLQRELPGYAEYARKTRNRLIPGLW
jgi:protein-S-isoprenylcysteine O-methyltransferase Ste14